MKAIVYTELGQPEEVLSVELIDPRPLQQGEVRVEVLSAPIHNADILQIMGLYGRAAVLPTTPGGEGVGRVLEIAQDVTQLDDSNQSSTSEMLTSLNRLAASSVHAIEELRGAVDAVAAGQKKIAEDD